MRSNGLTYDFGKMKGKMVSFNYNTIRWKTNLFLHIVALCKKKVLGVMRIDCGNIAEIKFLQTRLEEL